MGHNHSRVIARFLWGIASCTLSAVVLTACDSEIARNCPIPISPETRADQKKEALPEASRPAQGVRIYLDGSGSMKGFLAPGAGTNSKLFALARLRKAMTSLKDAASEPGVDVQAFMAFEGSDIREIPTDTQWRAITSSDCLDPGDRHGKPKPACLLKVKNDGKIVYTGQSLSHKEIFNHFLAQREQVKASALAQDQPLSAVKIPDVAVVVSDLISFNSTAPGDASEILAPLKNMMNQGFAVALVSLWSGFDGRLFDIPRAVNIALTNVGAKQKDGVIHYQGQMPLHMLIAGEPTAVRNLLLRLDERLANGSDKIEASERSILVFDPNATAQIAVQDVEINGATQKEKGWNIIKRLSTKDGIFLDLKHTSAAKLDEEKAIDLTWPLVFAPGDQYPGAIKPSILLHAWRLDSNASPKECRKDPKAAWHADSSPEKTLAVIEKNTDEQFAVSLLKSLPRLNAPYAVHIAFGLEINADLNAKTKKFIENWTMPEIGAQKAIQDRYKFPDRQEKQQLATLNLDQVVYGLWLETRELVRKKGDEKPRIVADQTIILQPK